MNNSCISTLQLLVLANIKIKPNEDVVLLLLNSDDDVCHFVDLFDTSPFAFRTTIPTPSLLSTNVDKSLGNSQCMKVHGHRSPSLGPPLHPSSFPLALVLLVC